MAIRIPIVRMSSVREATAAIASREASVSDVVSCQYNFNSPAGSIETNAPWKAPKRSDQTTTPAPFIMAGIQKKIMIAETNVAGIKRFRGPNWSAKY